MAEPTQVLSEEAKKEEVAGKVLVRNLFNVEKKDIEEKFEKYGRVLSVMYNAANGRAIVALKNDSVASEAIFGMTAVNPFGSSNPKFTIDWYDPDKKERVEKEIKT